MLEYRKHSNFERLKIVGMFNGSDFEWDSKTKQTNQPKSDQIAAIFLIPDSSEYQTSSSWVFKWYDHLNPYLFSRFCTNSKYELLSNSSDIFCFQNFLSGFLTSFKIRTIHQPDRFGPFECLVFRSPLFIYV